MKALLQRLLGKPKTGCDARDNVMSSEAEVQHWNPPRPTLPDDIWAGYRSLSYEMRNEFCLRMLEDNLANQKYLLYGWPIQQLYSRYATDFLPNQSRIRILEIGPGDNLMTTALWMLDPRVKKLTLLDKFKGQYTEKASYHSQMLDLIRLINLLPRNGFNNYYPFERGDVSPVTEAIRFNEDNSVELDPNRVVFKLLDDFSEFPFSDAEFDYLYSHATLEHFTDLEASFSEMFRVLDSGGLMVHQIDIRDHRNFSDPFRYLEQSVEDWNFGDLVYPVNQYRANQFRSAFEAVGFTILHETKIRREPEKLNGIKLAPEFEEIPIEDLCITGIVFILRKDR